MSYPYLKDANGQTVSTPTGKLPGTGGTVTVHGPNGPQQATIHSGGYAVPNKK